MQLGITSPASLLDRDPGAFLSAIWQQHFADVPHVNSVEIAYGKSWKRRLGCISLSQDSTVSHISINVLLRLADVPVSVLVVTIAHELAHYAHGFGSPLPRLYEYPHANGVVTHELEKRGLGEPLRQCQAWIDHKWFSFYEIQRKAGYPECVQTLDMSIPPTSSQTLAISFYLKDGGLYHPIPTPMTEKEAFWLLGYLHHTFSQNVQIQLIFVQEPDDRSERMFALELYYPELAPVEIASFSDWERILRWAAVPARFDVEGRVLSEDQRASEWQRVQHLRAIIFAVAHDAPRR